MSISMTPILALSVLALLINACSLLSSYEKQILGLERPQYGQQNADAIRERERLKAESLRQDQIADQQRSVQEDEPDEKPSEEPYGSHIPSTPYFFVKLSPWEKAALHWATAQEYIRLHSTSLNNAEAEILEKMHAVSKELILKNINNGDMSSDAIWEINRNLPHRRKRFEKWREQFMERNSKTENLGSAVAALNREQKREQAETSLNRRGCEWIKGNYREDRNPSSLCTPIRTGCMEGNCENGYGVYVSPDGTKLVGEFEGGNLVKPGPAHLPGTCVDGNCNNGQGTYIFSDGSKFVGTFKKSKPNGQGRKTWEIGVTYIGEFRAGMAEGEGEYRMPASHKRTTKTCLTGNCLDGQGVMMYPNDTKYVGQFKHGAPNGKGIYYWRDGEALEGEFENGELKAGGNYVSSDGHILIQGRKRGWHETYFEEEKSSRDQYISEHRFQLLGRSTLEGLNRQYDTERRAKEKRCREHQNRYSPQEWQDCGQYKKLEIGEFNR